MSNLYLLLNIPSDSGRDEIEAAFKKFKKELVKYNGGTELGEEEIIQQFPEIHKAYVTLLNPEERKIHDAKLIKNQTLALKVESEAPVEIEEKISFSVRLKHFFSYLIFGLLTLLLIGLLYYLTSFSL